MQIDGKRGTKGHRKQQNRRVIQRKANLCDRISSPLIIYWAEVTFLNVLEFIDKVAMQCHRVRKDINNWHFKSTFSDIHDVIS